LLGLARSPWFRRAVWPAALLLVASLGLLGWLAAQPPPPPPKQPALPTTFALDFRGRRPPAPLDLFGPDADSLCRPEEEGFRIALPAGRPPTEPVGLVMTSLVSGDFEITTGYGLVRVDPPTEGFGAGLEVYLMTATPTQEAVGFSRIVHSTLGDVFMCSRMTSLNTPDGKRRYKNQFFPASSRSGQLRVSRIGTQVTFWAADGDRADFRELCRYDLGDDDLKMVRLGANTGHARQAVDLRVTDLQIRAQALDLPQGPVVEAMAAGEPGRRASGWLTAAGIIGLLTALAFLSLLLLACRTRRAAAAGTPAPDTGAKPPPAASPVAFACPSCGHVLKVKAELSGKRGKCPKCGNLFLVPAPVRAGRPGGDGAAV
jgi:predicted RNA-binding Zn-ribbon protein involved in translation (DUF1610 family)